MPSPDVLEPLPFLRGFEDVRIVGLYGLMVMVNVALTPLSSESDTCMVKV